MTLTGVAVVAGFLALVVGSHLLNKRTGRSSWNPLWTAFTLTAVSLLYGIGGLMGYAVPRHNPFIDRPPEWVGQVVWPQVRWASGALLISLPFWWLGLRRLSREPVRR